MQVFLPYPSLSKSVQCLDKSRMGNQVWREAKTLLNGGWPNHPASKMFRGYEPALALYCLHGMSQLLANNWIDRSKSDNLIRYFRSIIDQSYGKIDYPWWFYDQDLLTKVCYSHQQNLLYKYPEFYSQYGWGRVPTTKPEYVWPV